MNYNSEYEKISNERKQLTENNKVPDWMTTAGYIMYKTKYAYNNECPIDRFKTIAKVLASHLPDSICKEAEEKFFNLMWKGLLAPSTPVYANTGTNRGHPVSCSGNYVDDSIDGFYTSMHEIAMLSKNGYGTSSYLGDIRPRGSKISTGGIADGVVPVIDSFLNTSSKVNQGNTRRGQWAGYIEIDHSDFDEICGYLLKHPGDLNIGWIISNNFIERLKNQDADAIHRFNEMMYIRSRFGKGYIWKNDVANELAPDVIKNCGIPIKASQLCTEIALPSNKDYTYSCVLSSLNLSKWDEFDEDTIFWSTIFLDCVCSEAIVKMENEKSGFEKILRFTREFRALGLGTLGFHTYLQLNNIAIESFKAHLKNIEIFKKINDESLKATKYLAQLLGEPKMCKGYGVRNATRLAIAPNMSSALLCGGVSQGIEPIISNTYIQNSSVGEMTRINPAFIKVLKKYNKYEQSLIEEINEHHQGSVQHLDFLSGEEKLVFRTAFEINQSALVRLAATRQKYIDQAQSLNLFFDTDEKYIAEVTKEALLNPYIKSLYYQRSIRLTRGSQRETECLACEG